MSSDTSDERSEEDVVQQRLVPGDKFTITVNAEYRNQNKRGGRPMVIAIPKGSEGEVNFRGDFIFPKLRRRGHMPFVDFTYRKHLQPLEANASVDLFCPCCRGSGKIKSVVTGVSDVPICPICGGEGKLWCAMCGKWGDHRSGECSEILNSTTTSQHENTKTK